MKIDLKSMSRKELEKLLADVKKALVNAQARDRRVARKAAERAAAEFGFSLDDLTQGAQPARNTKKTKAKKSGPKAPARFANPDNPAQTWTGKGRQPNWYRARIEKGASPQSMEI